MCTSRHLGCYLTQGSSRVPHLDVRAHFLWAFFMDLSFWVVLQTLKAEMLQVVAERENVLNELRNRNSKLQYCEQVCTCDFDVLLVDRQYTSESRIMTLRGTTKGCFK